VAFRATCPGAACAVSPAPLALPEWEAAKGATEDDNSKSKGHACATSQEKSEKKVTENQARLTLCSLGGTATLGTSILGSGILEDNATG
jgi:hypothetical protein